MNKPEHLRIQTVGHFGGLMDALASNLTNQSGRVFFGTASRQAGRMNFTGSMSVEQLLAATSIDRAKKGDSVAGVMDHSNRPPEPAHAKNLRQYLLETACEGEQFILPPFILNFGAPPSKPTSIRCGVPC